MLGWVSLESKFYIWCYFNIPNEKIIIIGWSGIKYWYTEIYCECGTSVKHQGGRERIFHEKSLSIFPFFLVKLLCEILHSFLASACKEQFPYIQGTDSMWKGLEVSLPITFISSSFLQTSQNWLNINIKLKPQSSLFDNQRTPRRLLQ